MKDLREELNILIAREMQNSSVIQNIVCLQNRTEANVLSK